MKKTLQPDPFMVQDVFHRSKALLDLQDNHEVSHQDMSLMMESLWAFQSGDLQKREACLAKGCPPELWIGWAVARKDAHALIDWPSHIQVDWLAPLEGSRSLFSLLLESKEISLIQAALNMGLSPIEEYQAIHPKFNNQSLTPLYRTAAYRHDEALHLMLDWLEAQPQWDEKIWWKTCDILIRAHLESSYIEPSMSCSSALGRLLKGPQCHPNFKETIKNSRLVFMRCLGSINPLKNPMVSKCSKTLNLRPGTMC